MTNKKIRYAIGGHCASKWRIKVFVNVQNAQIQWNLKMYRFAAPVMLLTKTSANYAARLVNSNAIFKFSTMEFAVSLKTNNIKFQCLCLALSLLSNPIIWKIPENYPMYCINHKIPLGYYFLLFFSYLLYYSTNGIC